MAELLDDAFLLRSIAYSDSSLILHCLTKANGRISLMARGARRAKSPFRAGLMPLHHLKLRWRLPKTGDMGTLVEVQRFAPLLPQHQILAGQTLLATASKLFPDGVGHGYEELSAACEILSPRSEDSGLCAATWHLLASSGWTGHLENCWFCDKHVALSEDMYWLHNLLHCKTCAKQQGIHLSPGFRKTIAASLLHTNIKCSQNHTRLWDKIMQDIMKTHR